MAYLQETGHRHDVQATRVCQRCHLGGRWCHHRARNGTMMCFGLIERQHSTPAPRHRSEPDGNVFAIAWEHFSAEEALQAGRDTSIIPEGGLWSEMILSFLPQRRRRRVVWNGTLGTTWSRLRRHQGQLRRGGRPHRQNRLELRHSEQPAQRLAPHQRH